jgi:enamine deaminase RidA (YjgF/YER057c/UK114 family)
LAIELSNPIVKGENDMKTLLTVVVIFLLATMSNAAENESKFINPEGLSKPTGYTHVVVTSGLHTIYIAGQVALNAKGEVVGKNDLKAQTEQVFENLKTALAAAGCTFNNVVKTTTFVVNYKAEIVPGIREIRSKYFSAENPPASTLVGVQALAREDFLIEIEAIAVIGN